MHLKTVVVAACAAVSLVTSAGAAEINAQGAEALRDSLTRYLPETLAKSGFISVAPATRRYEIVYDLAKLITSFDTKDMTLTGLKPLSVFAEPLGGDLWKLESSGRIDAEARYTLADVANTVRYSIGNYAYNGIFDPSIFYFRSGDFTSKDLKMTTEAGTQRVDAEFGSLDYTLATTPSSAAAAGAIDIRMKGGMSGFVERIGAAEMPPMEVRAETSTFESNISGLMVAELRDVVTFVLDHSKQDKLTAAEQSEIKDLLRKALPVLTGLDQKLSLVNMTVGTPIGDVGLKRIDYGMTMSGLTDASHVGLSFGIDGPALPDGVLPAMYAPLVPDHAEIAVAIPEMNLGGLLTAFLDKVDFSTSAPLSDADSAALGKMFMPDGSMTVEFTRIAATSVSYDIEMTGRMKVNPDDTNHTTATATLLARDYDKTIAYFQEAAKSDPEFNQISFGLMMAKGMAKTDADGRQRWDVTVQQDGSVEINGQMIKPADSASDVAPEPELDPDTVPEIEPDAGSDSETAPAP